MHQLEYLILGAGWTSTFLIPLLQRTNRSFASTSTTGREGTIKFVFEPNSDDQSYFANLPAARNVIIVFPLVGKGQSKLLMESYDKTHPLTAGKVHFMQLGSTGIYQLPNQTLWVDRFSAYDYEKPRAIAEDELRSLGGCVLNLSGLWGGVRDPKNWAEKIGATKDMVKDKTSLHMIHGEDVATAIVAAGDKWDKVGNAGQRWLITDGFVYDWWALLASWALAKEEHTPTKQSRWVYELMEEGDTKALPRDKEILGRCYDSREFWRKFEVSPLHGGSF